MDFNGIGEVDLGLYDKYGCPIDLEDFLGLIENPSYRWIAITSVGSSVVSTVWLGVDHAYTTGDLKIFETMVFDGDGSCGDCRRYSTLEEAKAGHQDVVDELRNEEDNK